MKAIRARRTKGVSAGSIIEPCDNSGAKKVRLFSVKKTGSRKSRVPSAGIGDIVLVSVRKGRPEMKKQIFPAVVARQKKEFRRCNGTRVKFEDNAVILLKDESGNPKGTMLKGPIPKEVCERFKPISKLARIVV